MERGLLWLPLLAVFIGLAWAGWNEFQKVEAYRRWAADFDRSKYDILALLGQSGTMLTWGKPTRREPIQLQSVSLGEVTEVWVQSQEKVIDPDQPPETARKPELVLHTKDDHLYKIPFTELSLALQWCHYLRQEIQTLQSASD